MKIYIPTLHRVDNQVTFNNLPDKYKENVIMVVQEHERDLYKYDVEYMVVPDNHGIAKTRRDICLAAGNEIFAMYDDDITMYYRDPYYKQKGSKSRVVFEDHHWDDWFFWAKGTANLPDMIQVGCKFSNMIPIWAGKKPPLPTYADFGLISGCSVINGKHVQKIKDVIPWTGCTFAEDMNFTLACLTNGYQTRISQLYTYHTIIDTEGGLEGIRDAQQMIDSHVWLTEHYKGLTRIIDKPNVCIEGATEIRVSWKKAYMQGLDSRVTKLKFS